MATSTYSLALSPTTPGADFRRNPGGLLNRYGAVVLSGDPASWVAKRYRISPRLAGRIAELAGIGPRS